MCAGLSERKKTILKTVIESYISSSEPIGSKALAEDQQIALSSATIRNELADLTEMGYLTQPYTSSGRIPTEKGYRFYVDFLMSAYDSTANQIEDLNELLKEKTEQLDKLIDKAGRLMSAITNYPAISIKSAKQKKIVKRFNIMPITAQDFVLIMLVGQNTVRSRSMHAPAPLTEEEYKLLESVLNAHFTMRALQEITLPEMMTCESELGRLGVLLDPIIRNVYRALDDETEGDVHVEGVDRLLEYPEFTSVDKLKAVLSTIDKKQDLLEIVESADKEAVNVYIGSENPAGTMSDSTLIFKTISANGVPVGAIGVIGPCRMEYSKVISTIEQLAKAISSALSESTRTLPAAGAGQIPDTERNDKS